MNSLSAINGKSRDVRLAPKVGRNSTKLDKSETFSFHIIGSPSQNEVKISSEKSPSCPI